MKLSPNVRYFIAGKTQSGKTYLSKEWLQGMNNRIIYDIKREYGDLGATIHTLPQLQRAFLSGCHKVVYQPLDASPEHFDQVCKFIFERLKNIMFVVDEVHKYCSKHSIPYFFNNIITISQGLQKIGVMAISQRPANVHNDIISQASVRVSFRMDFEDDADKMAKFIRVQKEDIMNLPKRHFIIYNDLDFEHPVKKFKPV